jgi:hypothetical protein
MEVVERTTEATLSTIHESLVWLNVTLGRMAARQEKMLVVSKKMTAALAHISTTTPMFMSEQQTTKPSSSPLFSEVQDVGAGAPHADPVFTSVTPTRCSTKSPGHYSDNVHAKLTFPASDTTHLLAMTSFGTGNYTLQGVGEAGMNTPAGCSTHVHTRLPDVPVARARNVDVNMSHGPPCQEEEHPTIRHPLL